MQKRPLTTLMAIGIVLFLAWLWRANRLDKFLMALTWRGNPDELRPSLKKQADEAGDRFLKDVLGAGKPKVAPGGGGIGDRLREAERRRRRGERPGDPILPDPYPPGTPGTWTPRWAFPNGAMLDDLERLRN